MYICNILSTYILIPEMIVYLQYILLLDHGAITLVRDAEGNAVLFLTASVYLLVGDLSSFYTV